MVAGSILPVAWHGGKLMFLFGKECNMEDSARGWSDFGGGCEDCHASDSVGARTRKVFNTAVREGVEETTGFLGTITSIQNKLTRANRNKKLYQYMSLTHDTYTIYFMPMKYDANLPTYYNDNHQLIWNNLNRKYINKTKLFEKIKVDWFSEEDMRRRRSEFRGFYREIVDRILAKVDNERKAFTAFATAFARPRPITRNKNGIKNKNGIENKNRIENKNGIKQRQTTRIRKKKNL